MASPTSDRLILSTLSPLPMPALDWIGKDAVIDHHRRVPYRLLQYVPEAGAGDPEAGNLIVEGDNLEALKALLPRYAGRVDCIYIDPPYNTGNEGWAYNDNVNSPQIRAWLGEVVDAEKLSRHDRWLCMMYPRLALLRELLAETGSIWVSLDDNENHHARVVLDDVFGASNFVANVVWQKVYSPKNSAKYFSEDHDHVIVYAKNKSVWSPRLLPRGASQDEAYKNPDGDLRGPWKPSDLSARNYYSQGTYSITTPSGRKIDGPPTGNYWRVSKKGLEDLDADGRIWWGEDGANTPAIKRFLDEVKQGIVPQTLWFYQDAGHTQEAKKELVETLDFSDSSSVFLTPKPTRLIQRILKIASGPDALILDAFAGSGTTAHAVLKQNALDGGRRRFVLVEMEPEVARPVTAERVRRAVEGYSFTGSAKEELLREKVTLTKLRKADKLLAKGEALATEQADRFDDVKQTVKDGYFVVTGERRETKRVDGLGSGFRYATLGPCLLDETGGLNPEVSHDDLARLVFYLATGQPMPEPVRLGTEAEGTGMFLGAAEGVGVYLLGAAGGDGQPTALEGDVLTRDLLAALPAHDGPRVVYGAATAVSESRLAAAGVEFRQIPYALPAA